MSKSEKQFAIFISLLCAFIIFMLLISSTFAQSAGFGDICNPVTGSPYVNFNPDLITNPIYATGDDYDGNANGCSWLLLPFSETDYRTPQIPISGISTEYVQYSFVAQAPITDSVVTVQLNYIDNTGTNHPVVFDIPLVSSAGWQSFNIDFDGFGEQIGGLNSFVSMQFGVSDSQSDVWIDKIRMLPFEPATATPTSTAIIPTPTVSPNEFCIDVNGTDYQIYTFSFTQTSEFRPAFQFELADYRAKTGQSTLDLSNCSNPLGQLLPNGYINPTCFVPGFSDNVIGHLVSNVNISSTDSVEWSVSYPDEFYSPQIFYGDGAGGYILNGAFGSGTLPPGNYPNIGLTRIRGSVATDKPGWTKMFIHCGITTPTVTPTATITPTATTTPTITSTPTDFPIATSTRTPLAAPISTNTLTPIPISTQTPNPTGTGVAFPTIPAPGTPFPIPTPIVGGSCNVQIPGNYDFCFNYGFTELNCWIIIPTISILNFPGFQICFELYGVVLKIFGYVVPTYLIVVAIAFLILWRYVL